MHFMSLSLLFVLASSASLVAGVSMTYDPAYDNGDISLSAVACSDGPHGLESHYPTFGSLPNFPSIGAAPDIDAWDSVNCGSCWQLTYVPGNGDKPMNIKMLAIDKGDSFVTGNKAMNVLTGNRSMELGRVNITAQRVDPSNCGI